MTDHYILLVEDAEIAQKAAIIVLTQFDCRVDIASDGASAIQQFEENRYDFVFMDLGLPDIDGFMVTQMIRARENAESHVPIVALTANRDDSCEARCLAAGMDDYVLKPLTREKATAVLTKWLGQ